MQFASVFKLGFISIVFPGKIYSAFSFFKA